MKMPPVSLLTLAVCSLSVFFPHGVFQRNERAISARFEALSLRLDTLASNVVDVAALAARGGSGPAPVSPTGPQARQTVDVPWRSFHACGAWAIETDRGRRLHCGDLTQWGLIVVIGPTCAVSDTGTILTFVGDS